MPEGHLIHHYARRHDAGLAGGTVAASSPQGRFAREAAALDGRVLGSAEAYGKLLFYAFDGDAIVLVHLGMRGLFLEHTAPAPDPRTGVRLRLAGERLVVDLIAPIRCELADRRTRDVTIGQLGPDPLRADADPEAVWRAVSTSGAAIGALLLDQSVLAGVGNVLRAEVLNLVRVHPQVRGRDLDRSTFDLLWATLVAVMQQAADDGRILTADPPPGVTRDELEQSDGRYVYKQERCRRCGTPVQTWTLAGRDAHACPTCQPPP